MQIYTFEHTLCRLLVYDVGIKLFIVEMHCESVYLFLIFFIIND